MAHKRRDNVTYDNTTIVNSTAVASFAKLDEETLRTSGVDLIPGIGTTLSDKITAAGYKNPYDLVVKFRSMRRWYKSPKQHVNDFFQLMLSHGLGMHSHMVTYAISRWSHEQGEPEGSETAFMLKKWIIIAILLWMLFQYFAGSSDGQDL